MTTVLIDGDIVCYRSAASCEPSKARDYVEPLEVAIMRADDLMKRILEDTQATAYRVFLTGSDNFRMQFNPEYKANRKDIVRPRWLQDVREHLVVQWNASVEDGQEADDAMGIAQCLQNKIMKDNWEGEICSVDGTIIASIDKDLLCIPGEHYNFVTGEFREQSDVAACRHFYWQLIMGDRGDNVFGYDGKARHAVPKFMEPIMDELSSYSDELDMFSFVRGLYQDDERLLMNMRCLWIRHKEGEIKGFPT